MSASLCRVVCYAIAAIAAIFVARTVEGPFILSAAIFLAVGAALVIALPRLVCAKADAEAASPAEPRPMAPAAPKPAAAQPVAAPAPKAAPASAAKPAAGHWSAAVAARSGKAGAAGGQTGIAPSATLSEEATLRDGVGSWRYAGEAK